MDVSASLPVISPSFYQCVLVCRRIASELGIDIERCKQSFSRTFSSYQQRKPDLENVDSLHQLISQNEATLEIDFCIYNLSRICRFCCRLRTGSLSLQQIVEECSSDVPQLNASSNLLEMINYTLYGNVSNSIFHLSFNYSLTLDILVPRQA
jgi:hypothetical protein